MIYTYRLTVCADVANQARAVTDKLSSWGLCDEFRK